jgi:hypothetical protein
MKLTENNSWPNAKNGIMKISAKHGPLHLLTEISPEKNQKYVNAADVRGE